MDDILEMVFDFVSLTERAKNTPASSDELAQRFALSRMIPGDGSAPGPDDTDQHSGGIPVQLTSPGGFESAHLVAVSRDGMRLRLAHPLRAGTVTIVRVIATSLGVELAFPCRVEWSDSDQMGLAFDGVPSRIPLARALSVGWNRPLDLRTGWGRRTVTAAA
ncbi:MAG: PilZ domain-containing protein [Deltaproteobacteria bacterium]|nr:PilZ domain-containing protein [Deltaproteobacteria bacterium]